MYVNLARLNIQKIEKEAAQVFTEVSDREKIQAEEMSLVLSLSLSMSIPPFLKCSDRSVKQCGDLVH